MTPVLEIPANHFECRNYFRNRYDLSISVFPVNIGVFSSF